jgi:hypothetical protein
MALAITLSLIRVEVFLVFSKKRGYERGEKNRMKEKNIAVVVKMFPQKWKQVEDFLDSVGATVIFVKQADANRKLVVKNLPAWEEEKDDDAASS